MTYTHDTRLDTAFDVLANTYRRRLLVAMLEHNPQDDDDNQVPVDLVLADEELDILRVQMRHVHLPKLEDLGFVVWNRDTNEISKGPRFDEIRPLLELMCDHANQLPEGWL